EAKLVRCSYGAVFDVVVDLRPDSPTFRHWESFDLRDDSQVSLYVPAGCAHGFQALTDPADVAYRTTAGMTRRRTSRSRTTTPTSASAGRCRRPLCPRGTGPGSRWPGPWPAWPDLAVLADL